MIDVPKVVDEIENAGRFLNRERTSSDQILDVYVEQAQQDPEFRSVDTISN